MHSHLGFCILLKSVIFNVFKTSEFVGVFAVSNDLRQTDKVRMQLNKPTIVLIFSHHHKIFYHPWAETWHRVWGDGKIFLGPNFKVTFFRKKFPFTTQKFLMTIFSHRLYFPYIFAVE